MSASRPPTSYSGLTADIAGRCCDPTRCEKSNFHARGCVTTAITKHDRRLSQKRANRLSRKPKLGTLDFSTARLLLVRVSISVVLIGMPCSSRSQTPGGDVAAQVRSQGYGCDQPVTAKRDVRLSKPDLAVWVLNCRNATYRVRLYPNLAAHVIKVKRYH
jgi:hypothetical protein